MKKFQVLVLGISVLSMVTACGNPASKVSRSAIRGAPKATSVSAATYSEVQGDWLGQCNHQGLRGGQSAGLILEVRGDSAKLWSVDFRDTDCLDEESSEILATARITGRTGSNYTMVSTDGQSENPALVFKSANEIEYNQYSYSRLPY